MQVKVKKVHCGRAAAEGANLSVKPVTVLRRPAVWPDAQLLETATVDLASAKLGYRCRT